MNTHPAIEVVEIGNYTFATLGDRYYSGCPRCAGTGHYAFDGDSDTCYACLGQHASRLGREIGTRADAEKVALRRERDRVRRNAAITARQDAELTAAQAILEAKRATLPESVRDLLEQVHTTQHPDSGFLADMAGMAYVPGMSTRAFTPKMIAALQRIADDRAQRAATPAPLWVAGRQQITGVITKVAETSSAFGYYETSVYKATIRLEDGRRVYGTLPSSVLNVLDQDALVGRVIALTATVTPSDDDPTFGFYSRPTKAALKEDQ